jgi:hypothetical protein
MLYQEGERYEGYIYTSCYTKEQLIARTAQEMLADMRPSPEERGRALATLFA